MYEEYIVIDLNNDITESYNLDLKDYIKIRNDNILNRSNNCKFCLEKWNCLDKEHCKFKK